MFVKITDRGSTVNAIINQFKIKIQEGVLKPGDIIPSESELSELFGVSRGSIREAIKILDALGIVTVKRGNGTYICDSIGKSLIDPFLLMLMLSENDINQLIDFRKMIEIQVVKMVVQNALESDIDALGQIIFQMESLIKSEKDTDKMLEIDIKFHNALANATHNIYVSKLYSYIMNFFEYYIKQTYKSEHNILNAYSFHEGIFRAIREKDEEKAIEVTNQSIEVWADKYKNIKI